MIDMLKFVEEAKTKTLVKLGSDIQVSEHVFFAFICGPGSVIGQGKPSAFL